MKLSCIKKLGFSQCPELPSIRNGVVRVTGREPGATATYSCDSEYNLSGAQTRTCRQDGTWSDQEPTCGSKFYEWGERNQIELII